MNSPDSLIQQIETLPGLVVFWDFQELAGQPRRAHGPYGYELKEMSGPIRRVDGGVFGPFSAELAVGQWLGILRRDCSALDIHGPDPQISLFAWLKRRRKPHIECEAIAGMWDETRRKRQYALFLDLRIRGSADQAGGHVSSIGGPTPGHRYCMDAAIGQTGVEYTDAWEFVGFTYNGCEARLYRNGYWDARRGHNPYPYPGGLFAGGPDGADFTVGAVHRGGSMGNWFTGYLGGLIVCSSVLPPETILALANATVPGRSEEMLRTMQTCKQNHKRIDIRQIICHIVVYGNDGHGIASRISAGEARGTRRGDGHHQVPRGEFKALVGCAGCRVADRVHEGTSGRGGRRHRRADERRGELGLRFVRALLDTHAVLWAAEGDARLGTSAAGLLGTLKTGEAVISDISLLEIAMLAKKGRIRLSVSAGEYLRGIQRNFPPLMIASEIAALAMELELPHGDPFDRIIVASARHHELPLLTRDRNIFESGLVRVVW